MDLATLLANPPDLHRSAAGEPMQMGLASEMLEFITTHVTAGARTLETGAGTSTIAFAMCGAQHVAITPSHQEIKILKCHCADHGLRAEAITFICEPSEHVLPTLESDPLDLVLIDGRHGFPAPFIDFFYTAGPLKLGGYLIVDDVHLSPCRYLRDLLAEQPQWRLEQELPYRSAIFQKLADGAEWMDWTHQPYVTRNSGVPTQLQVAVDDLRRRDYATLASRVQNTVRRAAGKLAAQRRDGAG